MPWLRNVLLAVGYVLPMLLLFAPVEIPSRFLWTAVSEHRGLADMVLIVACPALVYIVQTWWPTIRNGNARGGPPEPIVALDAAELFDATGGFSAHAELGRGGFGVVYGTRRRLGSLSREGRCAVKRLHDLSPESGSRLRKEARLLGKCRHENLLPLLGYCLDARVLCLVYPLCSGGNLEDRLHRTDAALARIALLRPPGQHHIPAVPPLSWRERLRIVRDATRALVYLHTPSGAKGVVLHRDVKPTNILLDGQGANAKLADVDLATESAELSSGLSHVSSSRLVGTAGFIDPLFATTGQYSQLTDGYAVGMSLLVCLVGKPALDALDAAEAMLEDPTLAPASADPEAEWPADVAVELTRIVVGLSWVRHARARMALSVALQRLEELADASCARPGIAAAPPGGPRECVVCMTAPRQVRYACGHCVCCEECTALLQRCPSCRVGPINVVARGERLAFEESFVVQTGGAPQPT